ncbi:hypothetical protein NPIL_642371 [Nephila pilipes]|uniref:Uncharacterized protein n=1 Tax=Nephila pilipes TaxID=299642 RepID=A0A8X6NZ86_NEPPI|nr:hypothetical protein NPIL_642371 [Nephila pilipes]
MINPINPSSKRICFNDETKLDSSFPDDAVPPHHFHLGEDIFDAMTYFATAVKVHIRQYKRDENNRLFPTKRGVCMSSVLLQSFGSIKWSLLCSQESAEKDFHTYFPKCVQDIMVCAGILIDCFGRLQNTQAKAWSWYDLRSGD